MKKQILTSVLISCCLLLFPVFLHRAGAQQKLPGYTIEHAGNLTMISFDEGATITSQNFFTKLGAELGIDAPGDFRLHSAGKDELGNNWYRYDQFYKNVPVLCGQYMLFNKSGQLYYARGKYHKGFAIDVTPRITAAAAIGQAKKHIGARKYSWENDSSDPVLKQKGGYTNATRYPVPELVIAPVDGIYSPGNFRLCYKMMIVAEEPVKECEVFIDAHTGQLVHINNLIMHADVPATGHTYYAGQQRMRAERYSRNFRLQESEGRKIRTLNMLNRITTDGAIDFVNATDVFSNGVTILDRLNISVVNDDWKGPFEDNGTDAKPDLYIEITDINGNMIYSKNDSLIDEADVPCSFNLKGRRLLTGNTYTIKLYDHDSFSPDDLLGTFTFDAVTGSKRMEDNGNLAVLFGAKGFTGAVDAHWGIERTYDYYNNRFQRTSYDGANSPITLFLHPHKDRVGNNGNNAFWSSASNGIIFGDGSGSVGSWTTLDLCGHELTHGYIQHRPAGDLIYERESGALNESFADIFAACIESEFLPGIGNWYIGEQMYGNSNFLRSFEKPKTAPISQPNTYGGDYWRETSAAGCSNPDFVQNDYCGVHYNSGVQNRWFYLLSEGGTGRIDDKPNGFVYKVPGLGMETASRIAYRNMMYLPADATFQQAYLESLKVAEYYNFLNPTPQYRAVREAWFAVGVAKRPVISSFTPTTGTAGTTTVTITGQNFTGISYVGFNETFVQPTQFTVTNNYTQITVKVPAGATTGYISIVAGYDTVKSTEKFIICAPLTISVSSTNANTFTVNVTGGSAPYTYSLDNVNYQTSNTFTNLQPGQNHTVYVKDAYGCPGQHTFFVSNPIQCNVQSGSGGQGTTFIDQILGATAGNVSVAYNMFSIPDRMDIYYNNVLMASTGGLVSGTSSLNFYYTPLPGGPYSCVIKISAPNAGTAWNFTAYCPTPKAKTNGSEAIVIQEPGMLQEEEGASPAILYPNPASAFTNLYPGTVTGSTVIRLMNITGKQIWHTTVTNNAPVPIPVKGLPAGTYLVTVAGKYAPVKTLRLIVAPNP